MNEKTQYEQGNCYWNANTWAYDHEEQYPHVLIVHGHVRVRGKLMGHAWLEFDDGCYDPAGERLIAKPDYYRLLQIDPAHCRYYTLNEGTLEILKSGHHGPWHNDGPVEQVITISHPPDANDAA